MLLEACMVSHAGKHATPHVCTWYTACSAAGLLSAASTYCSPVYICLPPCNTAAEVAAGQIGDHPQRERCCAKSPATTGLQNTAILATGQITATGTAADQPAVCDTHSLLQVSAGNTSSP